MHTNATIKSEEDKKAIYLKYTVHQKVQSAPNTNCLSSILSISSELPFAYSRSTTFQMMHFTYILKICMPIWYSCHALNFLSFV